MSSCFEIDHDLKEMDEVSNMKLSGEGSCHETLHVDVSSKGHECFGRRFLTTEAEVLGLISMVSAWVLLMFLWFLYGFAVVFVWSQVISYGFLPSGRPPRPTAGHRGVVLEPPICSFEVWGSHGGHVFSNSLLSHGVFLRKKELLGSMLV